MNDRELDRMIGEGVLMQRVNNLCKGHEWGCKCPEKKLQRALLSALIRVDKLAKQVEKAEKKQRVRNNIGANNPPCAKQSRS